MDNYKSLLAIVGNILKDQGFAKKGDTFCLFKYNNWGLINFQKSKNNSAETISFTINMGVSSTTLRRTIGDGDLTAKPDIEDCHWGKRIGFLLPQKQDYWWQVDNNTSPIHLIDEITDVLNKLAIPEIENHLSDESLESEWLTGVAEGATELQRYIYLTTLLKLNNKEKLSLLVEELRAYSKGKTFEYAAREHLKELETYC
jgi:hypothetical protein